METDLIIVGAGAAGLMAGVTAGECGLKTVLLERKHQPGRKLLLCGNNRCNLTFNDAVDGLVAAYGPPVGEFLRTALAEFPPQTLRKWFRDCGLPTTVHTDGRVFPSSQKADDVLHLFTDQLRTRAVPLVLNCPVQELQRAQEGLVVHTAHFELRSRHVLVATGGVSYPKTGSVGDGQRFARALQHRIVPYRPGLAGFELADEWLAAHVDTAFPGTTMKMVDNGVVAGETRGEILLSKQGARGPAMVDASRIVARRGLRKYAFEVDLHPNLPVTELARAIAASFQRHAGTRLADLIGGWLVPAEIASAFSKQVLRTDPNMLVSGSCNALATPLAQRLKCWTLHPTRPRPLKEAMVTVGGVSLDDVDPRTMASRRCPGLCFAGEVLDVDGPTGGFNLQAAFASARLAVRSIATRSGQARNAVRPQSRGDGGRA